MIVLHFLYIGLSGIGKFGYTIYFYFFQQHNMMSYGCIVIIMRADINLEQLLFILQSCEKNIHVTCCLFYLLSLSFVVFRNEAYMGQLTAEINFIC